MFCLVLPLCAVAQRADYVSALTSLTDPAKLATLGKREANPRLKKAVYWLIEARSRGLEVAALIDQIQTVNRIPPGHAALIKTNLLRNVKIADELGFTTPENMDLLRRGNAPYVTRGPYVGEKADVDHIIPVAIAPEIGNDMANLELMPHSLNEMKSDKVGARQRALARQFFQAGVIDQAVLARILAH